jgi:translation initiation factor RLI1
MRPRVRLVNASDRPKAVRSNPFLVWTSASVCVCMCTCRPQSLLSGMNKFLESLSITFRRDPTNYRPRINKAESIKDKEQKQSGNYFFLED